MTRGQQTSSVLVCAVVFILMELAALAMLHASSTLQDIWLNRISHRTMALLWRSGEAVRSQFRLDRMNRELQEENALLQERLRAYGRLETGAEELAHAAAREAESFRYIPATVVKASRNRTRNYIILNKGSEDGVHPHSGIISDRGVVGIVEAVDRHYSYGLTLMNPGMSVGARIGRDGSVAPLSWDGRSSDGALLHDLPLHHPVTAGDTVRTSGYSSVFPPDVPIGVTGATRQVDGSTLQVKVTLFQDFSTLRYVTVVENLDRDAILALEAAAEEGKR